MSTSAVSTSLGRLIAADAGWFFSLYPDAGEGGGGFRSSYKPNRAFVAKGSAADPERAAAEAGRRARSKLRRYCAANRLNRLGTLTYAESCHDPQELRSHLGAFFRDLTAPCSAPITTTSSTKNNGKSRLKPASPGSSPHPTSTPTKNPNATTTKHRQSTSNADQGCPVRLYPQSSRQVDVTPGKMIPHAKEIRSLPEEAIWAILDR